MYKYNILFQYTKGENSMTMNEELFHKNNATLRNSTILINQKKCVACGRCINFCPVTAIFKENKDVMIDQSKCIKCGKCIGNCPFLAISATEE
ncbi:4Fe-4S binding protein [Clostridium sp.]|uniref:DUF362 domain-containing protein n=1 Tax=Clostridium sp. TaxID=1506 RepID=UPI0032170602